MAILSIPIPKAKPVTFSGSYRRISAHWVNHAGAKYLQPSGVGTYPASLSSAHHTGNINLNTRFSKGEEAWPIADIKVSAEHLPGKLHEDPFQVGKSDSLIDQKSFYLVKHG
jgi:hypothetical protein